MRSILVLLGALVLSALTIAADKPAGMKPAYPASPVKTVTDKYWGVDVTDNYRWMENPSDPAVAAWTKAENEFCHAYLDKEPDREKIKQYLNNIYSFEAPSYYGIISRPGLLFAYKDAPPKEQPLIVSLNTSADTSSVKTVFDPTIFDATGQTAIDWFVPSLDGRMVAMSLSKNGSEDGSLYIFETATGKQLPDVIPRVQFPTAGGSCSWNADNSGIYYTRFPAPGEKQGDDVHFYQQVWFHKLGTPVEKDTYSVGKEFPRIAEVALESTHDGKYTIATVSNGDGGEYEHFVAGSDGKWEQITKFDDKVTKATFGRDGAIYMLSHKDAPNGKIYRMPLTDLELDKTSVAVAETKDASIIDFCPGTDKLYVVDMKGGPSQLRTVDIHNGTQAVIATEPISSVGGVESIAGDDIMFSQASYTTPSAWYRYDPSKNAPVRTQLVRKSKVNYDDCVVTREFATSKDGTKVPLNILHRKDLQLNGNNPCILYGYGGYGVNLPPGFSIWSRLWLDHGGIYIVANLRGGGEYGEDWHLEGNLTKKQNVFDDFAACAKWLVDNKYTNSEKLAIMGASNGGLLMGAALTQHPEYYRAVVTRVGVYDAIRSETTPNGEFNTTEYGTVKNEDQFKALLAYSPLANVRPGTAYPAILLTAGEHDGRVESWHSKKMTAALQTATSSDRPILLRTSATAGHGIGTSLSEEVETETDVYCFLFDQIGLHFNSAQ